jgi:hypothetical protein
VKCQGQIHGTVCAEQFPSSFRFWAVDFSVVGWGNDEYQIVAQDGAIYVIADTEYSLAHHWKPMRYSLRFFMEEVNIKSHLRPRAVW